MNGKLVFAQLFCFYPETNPAHLVLFKFQLLLEDAVHHFEPVFFLYLYLHRLRFFKIVIDRYGYRDLISPGECYGEINIDEEILEDLYSCLHITHFSFSGVTECRHSPSCDGVRHFNIYLSFALFVGYNFRVGI